MNGVGEFSLVLNYSALARLHISSHWCYIPLWWLVYRIIGTSNHIEHEQLGAVSVTGCLCVLLLLPVLRYIARLLHTCERLSIFRREIRRMDVVWG